MNEPIVDSTTGTDQRKRDAARWAARNTGLDALQLEPVSGDASFRRYFRFSAADRTFILMDAPPEKENSAPFVDIAQRLRSAGLNAPEIIAFDLQQGYGLLEDFGDELYRELINEESAASVFQDLLGLLEGMARHVNTAGLPDYNEAALATELDLFKTWYLQLHRNRPLSDRESQLWQKLCMQLIGSALEQPQVFVHRDFHSCNLLRTASGPGIIDFQDGVRGPLSYDLASLIWDRYIRWPRTQLEQWMQDAYAVLPIDCALDQWVRYCDLMGLQRNLKIVGIFARLEHRDGKRGYVEMIPRFYQYLLDVLARYPEFTEFKQLLEQDSCAP